MARETGKVETRNEYFSEKRGEFVEDACHVPRDNRWFAGYVGCRWPVIALGDVVASDLWNFGSVLNHPFFVIHG